MKATNKALLLAIAATISQCTPAPAGVVANTLFLECRGESKAGQLAVASVIYNRAKGNPSKLKAVCLARKQFSCWNQGYVKPVPRNAQERAIMEVLEGIERSMESGTFKPTVPADHYHTLSVNPEWSKKMKQVQVIGRHKFGVCK